MALAAESAALCRRTGGNHRISGPAHDATFGGTTYFIHGVLSDYVTPAYEPPSGASSRTPSCARSTARDTGSTPISRRGSWPVWMPFWRTPSG